MLDLARLRSLRLYGQPKAQKLMGTIFLGPNYNLPSRTKILVEGAEHLPESAAVLAMNHTDRYNYWPFQYWLWRNQNRYTATWVKGKYYENEWMGRFMEFMNNIPAPSKGYVITRDFVSTMGRSPSAQEYAAVRDLANGKKVDLQALPEQISCQARDMLGRAFVPSEQSYQECVRDLLSEMNELFVGINEEAFAKKLHLLIFPQGTRSIRLSQGRIGFVQAALRFKRGIVPIGCNGSDLVYPGGSPWAKGGTIRYRIGEYMPYESFAEHHLPTGLDPFAPEVAREHHDSMQALVDIVMERMNALLDPEYQFGDDSSSDGVAGAKRFV